jgi:hypothetical protein
MRRRRVWGSNPWATAIRRPLERRSSREVWEAVIDRMGSGSMVTRSGDTIRNSVDNFAWCPWNSAPSSIDFGGMVRILCFAVNMSWRKSKVAFRSAKGRAFAERKPTSGTRRQSTPPKKGGHSAFRDSLLSCHPANIALRPPFSTRCGGSSGDKRVETQPESGRFPAIAPLRGATRPDRLPDASAGRRPRPVRRNAGPCPSAGAPLCRVALVWPRARP